MVLSTSEQLKHPSIGGGLLRRLQKSPNVQPAKALTPIEPRKKTDPFFSTSVARAARTGSDVIEGADSDRLLRQNIEQQINDRVWRIQNLLAVLGQQEEDFSLKASIERQREALMRLGETIYNFYDLNGYPFLAREWQKFIHKASEISSLIAVSEKKNQEVKKELEQLLPTMPTTVPPKTT